jgi:CRP-like cAMP-binding protein
MVAAGTELVSEGSPTNRLFVLEQGWAVRTLTTADGGRQITAIYVPGDLCNLDCLLFETSGYGIRTVTGAVVSSISRDGALALMAEHPDIAHTYARLGLIEIAVMNQWMVGLGRRLAQRRLAHLLCELCVRCGAEDQSTGFTIPLTQETLGDTLGLTGVHINRCLQSLRSEGVLMSGVPTVTILDFKRLKAIAAFDPTYLHVETHDNADRRTAKVQMTSPLRSAAAR